MRHIRDTHPSGEKRLQAVVERNADGDLLNDLLAISQATKPLPTYKIPKDYLTMMDALVEYSLVHKTNPIRDGTLKVDRRSIMRRSNEQHNYFKDFIIKMLKENFDAELKDSKHLDPDEEVFSANTKSILIITFEADHARISKKNYFSMNLTIKKVDVGCEDGKIFPSHSLPIDLQEVPDKNGKTMQSNLTNIQKFLEDHFEQKYWKFFSITGDGAFMNTKLIDQFEREKDMKQFKYSSQMCTNHLDPLLSRYTLHNLLDDCDIDLKPKLFPSRKKKNDGKKLFFWGEENKKFAKNLEIFLEIMEIVTYETDPITMIKFEDQLVRIQKEYNKMEDDANDALKNPFHCDLVERYSKEFFKNECKEKHKIHRVPPSSDLKQRRLATQWEHMLGSYEFAHFIVTNNNHFQAMIKKRLKTNEVPQLDIDMKHMIAQFIAMIKYIKSIADTREHNENFTLIRALNIATKVACETFPIPFNNPFIK